MIIDHDGQVHQLRPAAPMPTLPAPHRSSHYHYYSATTPFYPSSTAATTMTIADSVMEANCVEIKEYLWQNSSDLTSLPSTMSAFAAIYTLIITLGVIGNSLVILSVMRHRSLQSVRNMFIVSLSCSDIVVSIVSGTITPITGFTKIWMFGAPLCKLVPVIQGTSLCFSTLTLTAISIDRFILIIYPMRRPIQKRHALQMIAINCAIAIAISAPMFFKQQLVDYMGFCGQFCTEDWGDDQSGRSTYGTIVFTLQFVVPFLVITFCYLMISLRLNKGMMVKGGDSGLSSSSAGPAASAPPQRNSLCRNSTNNDANSYQINKLAHQSEQRRAALKRRLRTNRMLMAMVGVFLCCWTPSVVFNFLRDYQWLPAAIATQGYLVGIVTHCISMSSTVWNPILYTALNEQFRFAFAELLKQLRGRRHAAEEYSPTRRRRSASRTMVPIGSRLISNATFVDMMVDGRGAGEARGESDRPSNTLSPQYGNGHNSPITTSRRFTDGSASAYRKGSEKITSGGLLRMASTPLQLSCSTALGPTGKGKAGRDSFLKISSAVEPSELQTDQPTTTTILTPLINGFQDDDGQHAEEASVEFEESGDDQV